MYDENTRMKTDDEITMTMNFPLAEEEWDIIMDCDLENTASITFHTKHGKEVEFVKRTRGEWEAVEDKHYAGEGYWRCTSCGYCFAFGAYFAVEEIFQFCPHCNAEMKIETYEEE